jgi:CheY-like chemotaxis protein
MASRILVADDSVTIQKVVELTFSKENFTLVQARSGEEAIRKAKEERPDLVLLDLVMPDKNGYEVCAALRAEPMLRGVPIILLAGTFETFDKERAAQVGANDYVTKPFESQQLISKVKQQLFSKTIDVGSPAAPAPGPARTASEADVPSPASPVTPPGPGRLTPPPAAPGMSAPQAAARPTAKPPSAAAPPTPPPGPLLAADVGVAAGVVSTVAPQEPKSAPASAAPPAGAVSLGPPAPSPPSPPSGPMELSLETVEAATEPAVPILPPEPLSLEDLMGAPESPGLGPLEASPPRKEAVVPAGAQPQSAGGPSEKLSLEDLIGLEKTPPPTAPAAEPPPQEGLPGEQVFDLTADMEAPSLPLVEVGKGEPPLLSLEEILGESKESKGSPAATGETLTPEPPEIVLQESTTEAIERGTSSAATQISPGHLELEPLLEASAAAFQPSAPEPPGEEVPVIPLPGLEVEEPTAPIEVSPAIPMAGEVAASTPAGTVLPDAPFLAAPAAAEAAVHEGPGLPVSDVSAMREAITERVARDLVRDLSEKLVERIERIVWEVVPDMAEILITKEIERIRDMAEDKGSS